jgi:hypothetical protein
LLNFAIGPWTEGFGQATAVGQSDVRLLTNDTPRLLVWSDNGHIHHGDRDQNEGRKIGNPDLSSLLISLIGRDVSVIHNAPRLISALSVHMNAGVYFAFGISLVGSVASNDLRM